MAARRQGKKVERPPLRLRRSRLQPAFGQTRPSQRRRGSRVRALARNGGLATIRRPLKTAEVPGVRSAFAARTSAGRHGVLRAPDTAQTSRVVGKQHAALAQAVRLARENDVTPTAPLSPRSRSPAGRQDRILAAGSRHAAHGDAPATVRLARDPPGRGARVHLRQGSSPTGAKRRSRFERSRRARPAGRRPPRPGWASRPR